MTVLVTLEPGANAEPFLDACAAAGLQASEIPGMQGIVRVECALADFTLGKHPLVQGIEDGGVPAQLSGVSGTIGKDLRGFNWNLARMTRRAPPWGRKHRIKLPFETSYNPVRTGLGVDVYTVDTGFRTLNPEFGGGRCEHLPGGPYALANNGDDNGHGSAVASAAVGKTVGVAPNANLWSVTAFDTNGSSNVTNIVTALGVVLSHYLSRDGTDRPAVLTMSFTINDSGVVMRSALRKLYDAGVALFCSAGNSVVDVSGTTPAGFPFVCAVGGLRFDDAPYLLANSGTNYGSGVRILTGAVDVYLQNQYPNGYDRVVGTSFASPAIAGLAACMLEGKPRLRSGWEVEKLIEKIVANATTGYMQNDWVDPVRLPGLPDKIAYLDPNIASEEIRPAGPAATDQRLYVVIGPEPRSHVTDQRLYVIVEP